MEVNTEAEPLRDGATSQDHDREEGGHDIGGEAKRLREGNDDKDGESGRHQEYMDEDEVDWTMGINILDSYRQEWISTYGKMWGSFEDESE